MYRLLILSFFALLLAIPVAQAHSSATPHSVKKLELTTEERDWLRKHQQIRIQMSDSYPPFEFRENGEWKGLAYDYAVEMCQRLGLQMVITGLTWSEALNSISGDDKKVDLLLAVTQSPEREKTLQLTKPYMTFPQVIITKKDGKFISDLLQLDLGSVAVEKNYMMETWLKQDLPSARIITTTKTREALHAVSNARADAYVGNLAAASYLIEKDGLTNLKVAAPSGYDDDALSFGVRKDWAILATLFNKSLDSFTQEDHLQIRQKWLSVRYEHGIQSKDLARWLGAAIVIGLAIIIPMLILMRKKNVQLQEQKELLKAILDNTFQLQGLLSLDGVLLEANQSSLDMIGESKNSVIGKAFWNTPWWQSDPIREKLKDAVKRCKSGETIRFESSYKKEDGSLIYIDFSLKPLCDNTGKVLYLIPEGRDITTIKNQKITILESEARLQTYFQHLPVACIFWDNEYRVQQWNPAAENIFGYSATEALGKTANELIIPEHVRQDVDKIWERLKSGDLDAGNINENVTKNGHIILCQWTNTPDFDQEGNVIGVISVAQDITEINKAREMMMQSEKMTMVAGLAAGMAHEVNNPLGIIAQDLQNLERRLSPSLPANTKTAEELGLDLSLLATYLEQRNIYTFIENMQTAVKRASTIMNNMLQFSIQSDSSQQMVPLADLIDQSVTLAANDYDLRKKYDFRNINIIREYDPGLPAASVCIPEMEQVIINILKNAAQAMFEANSPSPTITIRTGRHNGNIFAEFLDNGPGMSEDTRKRVFDPFFTTKDVGSGTGLGLSVSYSIITKNHGGTLSVASTPGHGACFSIKLPLISKG